MKALNNISPSSDSSTIVSVTGKNNEFEELLSPCVSNSVLVEPVKRGGGVELKWRGTGTDVLTCITNVLKQNLPVECFRIIWSVVVCRLGMVWFGLGNFRGCKA